MNYTKIFVLFLAVMISSDGFGALTLKDSYERALETNYGDKINQTLINQNIELKNQYRGNYLPKIAAKGAYLKQENLTDQKTIGLNLTHSLFKGGRDSLSIDSADKNITLAENQKITDRLNLYLNVISAYYNYFLNLNDYKNLELLKKQSLERVDETKKRVKVGRSRKGELLQAEAQLANAEAQVFNSQGLVKESEDRFYLLTGLDKKNDTFAETIAVPEENRTLDSFLRASEKRADVINKELKIEQANLDLKSSKSLHLPTLDLASNYYLNKRATTYQNTNWDVSLALTIPLFEGGSTSAKISESLFKRDQSVYISSDYKKNVEQDITSRFQIYHRYLDQVKAFDQAELKAKNSYDESLRDYRLGLVSNLDVLSSLNLYLDTKRNSEKTKIQAMMNLKMLEAAVGVLP